MKTLFKHCHTVSASTDKPAKKEAPVFTGVKMDRGLYKKARRRAKNLHQGYSDYVRQLIVRDIGKEAAK